jgi:hypothetical protein
MVVCLPVLESWFRGFRVVAIFENRVRIIITLIWLLLAVRKLGVLWK